MSRFLFLAVLVPASLSCSGGKTHELTDLDSGSRVAVARGDLVEESLESNPSTGYRWDPVTVPAALKPAR